MKISIDSDEKLIIFCREDGRKKLPLYSQEGLKALTEVWIKVQWNELNSQSISWHGFPIFQLPEDLLRLQEAIRIEPDVIVETGVNQGGSAVFLHLFAS
jgi:cephalosporin hydroxylase